MTVLVDTSAWVEYLRETGSPHHRWLRAAIINDEPLGWTDPVLYELTAGARSAKRADELRRLLLRGPLLPVQAVRDWDDAGRLYRTARSRGLTVRSGLDCLIVAVARRTGTPVLTTDRDVDALASVSDLVLLRPDG